MWKSSIIRPDELSLEVLKNGGRDYPRELARQRDKRICQMCGKKWQKGNRRFDVHHIIGCGDKSLCYDRVKDLGNLITYCHKCHLNLHSVRRKMSHRNGQQKLSDKKSTYYKNRPLTKPRYKSTPC